MKFKIFKKHFNNFLLFILAGGFFWIGASFLEYEISKIQKKNLIWVDTPKFFDLTVSALMILGSMIILAMLVLIYYKKLENRPWLWAVVFSQSILIILLSKLLGYNRFIWILFPNTFSILK